MTEFAIRPTWRLYRFWCGDILLYVGQTMQTALERLVQHLQSKWWAPLITRWDVDPRVFGSLDEVRMAERDAIHAERPKCNTQHNSRNPERWVSWADVPAELRPATVAPVDVRTVRAPMSPVKRWTIVAVIAWTVLDAAVARLIAMVHPVPHEIGTASIVTALLLGLTAYACRPRRRRRRRRSW